LNREEVVFPFTAVVGQEDTRKALLLNAVSHQVGGVLARGRRGTAKSTLARGLAYLLPEIDVVADCPFGCDPGDMETLCGYCAGRLALEGSLPATRIRMKMVTLPLNATEEMVSGTLDIERALRHGEKSFEPGLLARANRSILYVDEVNLLEDHIVDILLDAAAMGVNVVEREGISFRHGSRFILIGTMNPEEGDLRPQLEDRFGLCAEADAGVTAAQRTEILRRNLQFSRNPLEFESRWNAEQETLRRRIFSARERYPSVEVAADILENVACIVHTSGADGHRADISMLNAARALAALEGSDIVRTEHVVSVAGLALNHRLRRGPLGTGERERLDIEAMLTGAQAGRYTPSASPPGARDVPGRESGGAASAAGEKPAPPPAAAAAPPGQPAGVTEPPLHRSETTYERPGLRPPARTTSPAAARDDRLEADAEGLSLPDRETAGTALGRRDNPQAQDTRGRYYRSALPSSLKRPLTGSDIAIDATIRASARRGGDGDGRPRVLPEDIRVKMRKSKHGASILFVVDASASMGAQKRLAASRQAILSLLVEAYQKRDRVGLVVFKDACAQLIMSPTSSASLANRLLSKLSPGGATPLPHGLSLGYRVLKMEISSNPRTNPVLVLISDGGGNVTIGNPDYADPMREALCIAGEIRERGIQSVVIDSAPIRINGDDVPGKATAARRIAEAMGGAYFPVRNLTGDAIIERVNQSTAHAGLPRS